MQAVIAKFCRSAIVFILCSFVALSVVMVHAPPAKPVRLSWLVDRQLKLWLWCEACSHHKTLDSVPLLRRFGDAELPALKSKFRCTQCGGKEIFLRPDWHGAGWTHGVVSKHDKLPE